MQAPSRLPTQNHYVPPKLQSTRSASPKPIVRGQMEEDPALVRIPAPEELGLGTKKAVSHEDAIDWSMVERRMDQLGVTRFQMQRTADGFSFSLELRGKTIVGRGTGKNEAVRAAFAQVAN